MPNNIFCLMFSKCTHHHHCPLASLICCRVIHNLKSVQVTLGNPIGIPYATCCRKKYQKGYFQTRLTALVAFFLPLYTFFAWKKSFACKLLIITADLVSEQKESKRPYYSTCFVSPFVATQIFYLSLIEKSQLTNSINNCSLLLKCASKTYQ